MDKRPWDISQTGSNTPLKRSWDSYSTSTDTPSPAGSQNQQQDFSKLNEQSQWKKRQHSVEIQRSPGWESNLQTSLWLSQQVNAGQGSSLSREPLGQQPQTSVSAPTSARDDDITPGSVAGWSRYLGDDSRYITQDMLKPVPRPTTSTAGRESTHGRMQAAQGFQTRLHDQGPAARRTLRPATFTELERGCDKCSQFELFIQNSVTKLTSLGASLAKGPWVEVYAKYHEEGIPHSQLPQISSVHRMVELLEEACRLSQHLIDTGPVYTEDARDRNPSQTRIAPELNTSLEDMRHRFLADSQDVLKQGRRDSTGGEYFPTGLDSPRRISPPRPPMSNMASSMLPPIQASSPIHAIPDQQVKLPSMKPPPTPGRPLPSPPAYSMPLASPVLYTSTTQSSIPPISSTTSIQAQNLPPAPTAIAAHTAALQHEVSLKSYALQTLQSEHDKLLAALSRSQARARALEEKQIAADNEVNTLSDERLRLIEKTTELEAALDEVGKARDDYRMAGVREGQQYVEIVRMASQLEAMAVQERQRLKERLAAAAAAQSPDDEQELQPLVETTSVDQPLGDRPAEEMTELEQDPRIDSTGRTQVRQDKVDTQGLIRESSTASSMQELVEEVRQLRRTCEMYESALQTIRGQTRRIDEVIDSVAGPRATIARAFETLTSGKDPPEVK